MKKVFVSHKRVTAVAMNRRDYNNLRGWELPTDEDGTDEGYLVEYLDGGKPNHPDYKGYISWSPKEQFDNGYTEEVGKKTLHNSDASGAKRNVKDIKFFGNGDTFQLISKASSASEGWMKSTKAMQIDGVGCVIQVSTQQGGNVAEALVFAPGVYVAPIDPLNKSAGRRILAIN